MEGAYTAPGGTEGFSGMYKAHRAPINKHGVLAHQPEDRNVAPIHNNSESQIKTENKTKTIGKLKQDGATSGKYAHTTGGDALLLAAEDSDSELSDDPTPYCDRTLINHPLRAEETFEPHDTDPTKINAIFHLKLSTGSGYYTQRDVLPEQRDSAGEDQHSGNDNVFVPDLRLYKVPERRKVRKSLPRPLWVRVAPWRWEQQTLNGETAVWSPRFVYRRFNARTHEYEQIYVAQTKMENVDPNDKKWVYSYNKWIDQIKRRSDSSWVAEKRRDHWTVPEICAMYAGINKFLHENGIDAYYRMSVASLQNILDEINEAGRNNRGIDSLRGQMASAHEGKNVSLAYLRDNVRDLVEYLKEGGVLSDEERYPEKFIPEEEFPTAPRKNARRREAPSKDQGETEAVGAEGDADEELSDPPSDMEL